MMYYYIVNPSAGDRQWETVESKLTTRLKELGIEGEIAKTLDTDDAARITKAALKQGAQTIVVAGGDKTVNEVITALHESGKTSTSIGIIPLGHSNVLADQLGIGDWQQACELLAARRLRDFRLMHINDNSFLHSCCLLPEGDTTSEALIEVDGSWRLKGPIARAVITNTKLSNPSFDDLLLLQLEAHIATPTRLQRWLKQAPTLNYSQLHARVAVFEFPTPYRAIIDGRQLTGTQFRIRLSERPIHIISAKYGDDF